MSNTGVPGPLNAETNSVKCETTEAVSGGPTKRVETGSGRRDDPDTARGQHDETFQSEDRIARLQHLLKKKLGPAYLSFRRGNGGIRVSYIEGWRVINLANEVFGYDGWSSEIVKLDVDFCDENPETHRCNVGVTAIIKVTLKDGASHQDIGYGKIENSRAKGDAIEKCKKEAVTDALKRCMRQFGNLMGNCLYDKGYLDVIHKMSTPKPVYDMNDIHTGIQPALAHPRPSVAPAQVPTPNPHPPPAHKPRPTSDPHAHHAMSRNHLSERKPNVDTPPTRPRPPSNGLSPEAMAIQKEKQRLAQQKLRERQEQKTAKPLTTVEVLMPHLSQSDSLFGNDDDEMYADIDLNNLETGSGDAIKTVFREMEEYDMSWSDSELADAAIASITPGNNKRKSDLESPEARDKRFK